MNHLVPIYLNTPHGVDIYRRTLTYICAKAASKIFPERHFTIGHSLSSAYYIELEDKDNKAVSEEDLKRLDEEVRSLIKQALPITPKYISWADAVSYFKSSNSPETLSLIKMRNTARISVIECDGFYRPAYSAYLDNTSKLTHFMIIKYGDPWGFLLHFPHTSTPFILDAFIDQPRLFETFQNTKKWEKKAKVACVGDVNEIARDKDPHRLKDFIIYCEGIQNRMIVETATKIINNKKCKLILIAGPSSSAKTTFARRLCVHLRVLGKSPICISLDNFYRDPKFVPRDEKGDYDFEALEALDLELINSVFCGLLEGKEVEMPKYNFKIQKPEKSGIFLKMEEDSMLVVEGIHGLNDKLTEMIPKEAKFKIFISALTRINIDECVRISTTDTRMLRRMVRDYQFRGNSAEETIRRWPSVRAGEEKHIFPFQNTADVIFNSSVEYEINALKMIAEPLLKNIVPSQKDVYPEAQRLLSFLSNFEQINVDKIPPVALVREFLGGSSFADD